jgi:coatomer subunit alpha
VQEPQTQFELAIECGNLAVAVKTARALDKPSLWTALGQAALSQGDIEIVELAYQKLKNFEKLSFLYLITGDTSKLERMSKIAEHRGNHESRFQHSLWTGDIETRIRVFKELDLCTSFKISVVLIQIHLRMQPRRRMD